MTDELCQSLDDIRKLMPQLNKVGDDVNEVVAHIGAFLSECDVGIPAEIGFCEEQLLDDENGNKRERISSLKYGRVQGLFQIAVETCIGENTHEPYLARYQTESIKPWSCCTRDLKLASFVVLPRLLNAIAENVRKMTGSAAEAVTAVDKVVKAMKAK